jgi:hypothetical protein
MNHPVNSRYDLFSRGIFVDPIVPIERLKRLAQKLKPIKTNIDLLRIGANEDGGYLIPDDLAGISACYSPGVDQIASFENNLLAYGIPSHLADYSVDGPPVGATVASFLKKYIGANDSGNFISLEKWIEDTERSKEGSDLLLQMDIEGGEYESILSTPNSVLNRFRIIAIEFHNIETWAQTHFLSLVEATFEKLLANFYIVHNHPNNAMGIVDLNGFLAPRLLELTFLRKDRVSHTGGYATLPHVLDKPNLLDRPDLLFPSDWL